MINKSNNCKQTDQENLICMHFLFTAYYTLFLFQFVAFNVYYGAIPYHNLVYKYMYVTKLKMHLKLVLKSDAN